MQERAAFQRTSKLDGAYILIASLWPMCDVVEASSVPL